MKSWAAKIKRRHIVPLFLKRKDDMLFSLKASLMLAILLLAKMHPAITSESANVQNAENVKIERAHLNSTTEFVKKVSLYF
ncbi:MAG: hypothetical protein ACJ75J_10455 [Cytophagaceae bacterium]